MGLSGQFPEETRKCQRHGVKRAVEAWERCLVPQQEITAEMQTEDQ